MSSLFVPVFCGAGIVALAAALFLLGLKLGVVITMADLSKLSAGIDRAIAQHQADQATIAAGDQQSEIDALTSKLDAEFPPPPEAPAPVEPVDPNAPQA